MEQKITCLICESKEFRFDYFPPNIFNEKKFHYNYCKSCGSVSIYPIPDKDDFNEIYGVEDHDYLKNLKLDEKLTHHFSWNKYNYQRYQIELFETSRKVVNGKKLLDFATGSGFYLAYAKQKEYEVIGIEYDEKFSATMSNRTDLKIISLKEFEQKYAETKFDIIHFGHILEHLENPIEMLKKMKCFCHEKTIIIVDGPLEINFCLSRWFIQLGSFLRHRKYNTYAPQHLTFTNHRSQLIVFEKAGLKKIKYKILEQDWSLSSTPNWKSPKSIITAFVSLISIHISKIFPKMGNVFHYVGKFEQ